MSQPGEEIQCTVVYDDYDHLKRPQQLDSLRRSYNLAVDARAVLIKGS